MLIAHLSIPILRIQVYQARKNVGKILAELYKVKGDVVIPVPDSARPAALGFSEASRIPIEEGLMKDRYGKRGGLRSFIEPEQKERIEINRRIIAIEQTVRNKEIILIDDSIVRGTTTPQVLSLLKSAGAKEIHVRVCAPPITHPCHFGVDLANKSDLIAAQKSVSQIKEFIGADSLYYLTVGECLETFDGTLDTHCTACFTGDYPIPVQLELDKMILER